MLRSLITWSVCIVLVHLMSLNCSAIQLTDDLTTAARATSFCQTKVEFYTDYNEAFAEAKRVNKPLFVVHLSGDLQNETFT